MTDPLTGLPNRQAFVDSVQTRRHADPTESVGIVFIDLDGFKQINDTHGHAVGDAILVQAATRIAPIVVAPDAVYRLGGDEFVVLSTTLEAGEHIAELADRLRTALTASYDTGSTSVTLSASVGATWGSTDDIEQLLHNADAHMYQQKARQRSRAEGASENKR